MENRYQKITINDIPDDLVVEGYYWYSDETRPEVIKEASIDKTKFTTLPFVVEGNFFDKSKSISIQVKNIDGVYHIAKIDLSALESTAYSKQNYIAHDLEGIGKFKMVEAWEEEEDDLLEGMKVLVPTWTAFAGFIS